MSSAPQHRTRLGLLIAMMASSLAACSGDYYVPAVRTLQTDGGTYQLALQQGYADVAQWKQDERNWADSELMLAKARAAAAGTIPTLEPAPNAILQSVRDQLEAALTQGRINTKPVDAAMAQVAYDCLARSVLNPPHPEGAKTHSCQTMFDEAMVSLTSAPDLKPLSEPVAIYFGRNASAIADQDQAKLKELAAQILATDPPEVVISGYSDSTGTLAANIVMAQKRVTAVSNALTQAGVSVAKIKQMVYGEEDPALSKAPIPAPKPDTKAQKGKTPAPDLEASRRRVTVSFAGLRHS